MFKRLLLIIFVLVFCGQILARDVRHYVFFGMDRERFHSDKLFLDTKKLEGAQVAYFWNQLEPERDKYDLSLIREDLAYAKRHGKRLWIQIQDVTFSDKWIAAPRYLQNDPKFNGGIALQYRIPGEDEARAVPQGSATRRWDPAVQERLFRLFDVLAKEFDGKIEGINLAETSVTFGQTGRLYPSGFTPRRYRDAVIENIKALRRSFKHSKVMIYANFMPGEWRPSVTDNKGYLEAVYAAAIDNDVSVGGPDLMPHRPGQLGSSYPLIRDASKRVTTGVAVQDGNYAEPNRKTGKPSTIAELIAFATDYLNVNYIFWCTEEPYYTRDVVAFLSAKR